MPRFAPGAIQLKDTPPVVISSPTRISAGRTVFGVIGLLLSIVTSVSLVVEHLAGIVLPGCGPESACATAAASVWGKIPWVDWPLSAVGAAYFVAALTVWLLSPRGVSPEFRVVVRLGGVVSLLLTTVLLIQQQICLYCLLAHIGNLLFWFCVERAPWNLQFRWRPVIGLTLVFAALTGALAIAEKQQRAALLAEQEAGLEDSIKELQEQGRQQGNRAGSDGPARSGESAVARGTRRTTNGKAAETTSASASNSANDETTKLSPSPGKQASPGVITATPAGFTGRYHWGPVEAAIRIVVMTDYQCPACRRFEADFKYLMEQRDDVSISVIHYPMCGDCNRKFEGKKTAHANACWAARTAEAAGILWGNDGFWKMHHWLFEQNGSFDQADLTAMLTAAGHDPAAFLKVVTSDETLRNVHHDIERAIAVGIYSTPLVFINGVEIRGVFAPNAIGRAVAALAATNPEPRSPLFDRPPVALQKYVADWREQPVKAVPEPRRVFQPATGQLEVRIDVWGDYMEPICADADLLIREAISGRPYVRYSFRHYPMNPGCNPEVKRSRSTHSCMVASAVEAAAELGGHVGYQAMHVWLLEHAGNFSRSQLRAGATELGFDANDLLRRVSVMDQPTFDVIKADAAEAAALQLQKVPMIYINGKLLPRFRLEGADVIGEIIDAARGG